MTPTSTQIISPLILNPFAEPCALLVTAACYTVLYSASHISNLPLDLSFVSLSLYNCLQTVCCVSASARVVQPRRLTTLKSGTSGTLTWCLWRGEQAQLAVLARACVVSGKCFRPQVQAQQLELLQAMQVG